MKGYLLHIYLYLLLYSFSVSIRNMPSVVAYFDVYTAAFAGRRMATVLPRNRGLKTCGYRNKKTYSVLLRYASAATLTQYPHSSVPNRHASFITRINL